MRILHTADWHMNSMLGHRNRTIDIENALTRIAGYLKEHKVDVLIAAGDLFSERSRPDELRHSISFLRDTFADFLQQGGTIIAISGNHDSEVFFETLRDTLAMVTLPNTNGRLYITPNPHSITLTGRAGEKVQFVLMPYPTARCYLQGKSDAKTPEERNNRIRSEFLATFDLLKQKLNPTLPSVLVSHVYVRGVPVGLAYGLSEEQDIVIDLNVIPARWAYVAYGHIHKPQRAMANAEHVRYSGSIERMDAGEREDNKSVVLIEIGSEGRVAAPVLLPLESTPIYKIEFCDPTQIASEAGQYKQPERALVTYKLHWQPGEHNREALHEQIRRLFPLWYAYEEHRIGEDATRRDFTPQHIQDVPRTTREYLLHKLANDPQRERLLELADQLLAEEEGL